MVVVGALTLPASIPLLYSSYLATPPRSVEASQARVTLEEVEETTRRFWGAVGGSSVAGVVKVTVAGALSFPAESLAVTVSVY